MPTPFDASYLKTLWDSLYGSSSVEAAAEFDTLLERVERARSTIDAERRTTEPDWYEHSIVYALYVHHFNKTFEGLVDRLDYLESLGVRCLWLLPILESPMRDEGFDISDFHAIRASLFSPRTPADERTAVFRRFLAAAHERGIRVVFDIAVNHVSADHPWFRRAVENPDGPEHRFFHWSKTGAEHRKARVIFKGMLDSNWTLEPRSGAYYFHRFYPHQPDLNYASPRLLREVLEVLLHWIIQGVDGFRLDAVPYLWKDDETSSENHPKTHTVIKIFRTVTELVHPGTLLLAEACQPPREVVDYFGTGDECQGAYHFPLMPRVFLALAEEDPSPIGNVLDPGVTPDPPPGTRWFTFLRCHDELTLEMVGPAERETLYRTYCRKPSWDFRQGEGISSRLIELVGTPERALLAHAILLGTAGTPIIYYGDEVLEPNNDAFNDAQAVRTGYTDSRNLVRGPLDWTRIDSALSSPPNPVEWHYRRLSALAAVHSSEPVFSCRNQEILTDFPPLLGIVRESYETRLELWYNLSADRTVKVPRETGSDLHTGKSTPASVILAQEGWENGSLRPNGFVWFRRT